MAAQRFLHDDLYALMPPRFIRQFRGFKSVKVALRANSNDKSDVLKILMSGNSGFYYFSIADA